MKKFLILLTVLCCMTLSYAAAQENTQTVLLNTKTLIYHPKECFAAKRCNKNCVSTTLQKARAKGAKPCKICSKKN